MTGPRARPVPVRIEPVPAARLTRVPRGVPRFRVGFESA